MFISGLLDTGPAAGLVNLLAFNEARLAMLAENIANYGTPHYRMRQLDVQGFQKALREAMDDKENHPGAPLTIESGREVQTAADGTLTVTPSQQPVENILFHDGSNASIEAQMAALAETGLTQELASTILKNSYVDATRKAIRGTV